MQTLQTRAMTIAAWSVAMLGVGRWADISTPTGWALLAMAGIVPPIIALKFWGSPTPSMSESIHKARD
jgi:uncharacterized membrane protein YhaH (DUF805 family)